jgi:hypothetical protein
MANPNPTYKYKHLYGEPMSEQSLSIRLPATQDKYVRSLPNRAEWLRRAIAEAYQRDMDGLNDTDSDTTPDT